MNVYVAMEKDPYHSSTMLSIFSTQENADTFLDHFCIDGCPDRNESVFVAEMIVDPQIKEGDNK
jgi:hypothetical protein